VTRDYLLEMDEGPAPLLTVWGGKITTFRRLAEEAADQLEPLLRSAGRRGAWTRGVPLPGGDLSAWIGAPQRPDVDFGRFEEAARLRWPRLPAALVHRLARAYGSRIETVLSSGEGLGAEVAPGLFEAELRYLHDHEWARGADDVLWRRSKLGLHYGTAERAAVAAWWEGQRTGDMPTRTTAAGRTETSWN
jgi:glycerol-3-phosphate dehydrogenase